METGKVPQKFKYLYSKVYSKSLQSYPHLKVLEQFVVVTLCDLLQETHEQVSLSLAVYVTKIHYRVLLVMLLGLTKNSSGLLARNQSWTLSSSLFWSCSSGLLYTRIKLILSAVFGRNDNHLATCCSMFARAAEKQ